MPFDVRAEGFRPIWACVGSKTGLEKKLSRN